MLKIATGLALFYYEVNAVDVIEEVVLKTDFVGIPPTQELNNVSGYALTGSYSTIVKPTGRKEFELQLTL